MRVTLLYLTCLMASAHSFSDKEQLIKDVLDTAHINRCDFGYVYDHQKTNAPIDIIQTSKERQGHEIIH